MLDSETLIVVLDVAYGSYNQAAQVTMHEVEAWLEHTLKNRKTSVPQ